MIQILSVAGMFGMFFLGALYLRRVLGYDPLQIGLAFLPVTLTMGTLSIRYSERLVTRFGPVNTDVPGLVLITVALVLFAQVPVDGSYVRNVMPSMLLLGVGAGVCFPALMNVAMSGVERRSRPAWPRDWSTPPPRSAARWAWRFWRHCRPRAATASWRPVTRRRPP